MTMNLDSGRPTWTDTIVGEDAELTPRSFGEETRHGAHMESVIETAQITGRSVLEIIQELATPQVVAKAPIATENSEPNQAA